MSSNPYEEALIAAGDRLGEAIQNASEAEKKILAAMHKKLDEWAREQETRGVIIDRSAFFAAGIIAHDQITDENLIEAASEYIDKDWLFCKSLREQSEIAGA